MSRERSFFCSLTRTPYGNLLNDGTSTHVYDAENRLISVTKVSPPPDSITSVTTYAYNGDCDRIKQEVDADTSGSTFERTRYVIDTATPLTMVLSETTVTLDKTTQAESNGVTLHYWHGLDLLAQSDGTQTEYLAYDGLGSVRQVTDGAGLVAMAQTFDPYGNLYTRSGVNSTKYAFTGEAQDANGLLFLRARYYSAGMGRFLNADPSRLEHNPYLYSAGNPVMLSDPSGLCADCASETGSTASKPSIAGTLTITINPVLLPLLGLGCSEEVGDFVQGMLDQFQIDLVLQPYNTTISIVAQISPPGAKGHPLLFLTNLSTNTVAGVSELNAKYWGGSDAYRAGRQTGRILAAIIGVVATAYGGAEMYVGFEGTAVTTLGGGLCTLASGGACAAPALAGVAVSGALVAEGAAIASWGALVMYATGFDPNNPVGGKPPTPAASDTLSSPRTFSRGSEQFVLEQGTKQWGWKHIFDGHINPMGGGTKFPLSWTQEDILSIMEETITKGNPVAPNPGSSNIVIEYATNFKGAGTNLYRFVAGADGRVITFFATVEFK